MTLTLDTYRPLGRSGLLVSPLALGTATFGTDWGWGADEQEARRLFDTYVDRGGNVVDTAVTYTDGASERMLGSFVEGRRDRLVLATKYSTLRDAADPNSGGAGRKSLVNAVETSLRRLRTDHLDLLYLHVWDDLTPPEELLQGLDDLVHQGKVLYLGISNTPAWQVARLQTMAELRGWSRFVALQLEHHLVQRTSERELLPMADALGLGVMPYSPLAGGVLSGKYGRRRPKDANGTGLGRSTRRELNETLGNVSAHAHAVVDVVQDVAEEIGHSAAQVALAWLLRDRRVSAPVLGARTLAQLEDNLGALDVDLTAEQVRRLDNVSAVDLGQPHTLLASEHIRRQVRGGLRVEPR